MSRPLTDPERAAQPNASSLEGLAGDRPFDRIAVDIGTVTHPGPTMPVIGFMSARAPED